MPGNTQETEIVRSKRYKEDVKKHPEKPMPVDEAVDIVKSFKAIKFDQSVELIVNLGIDPKQADQMIRGSLSLPHGVGKTKRVVCFCPDHLVEIAKQAGAIKAGGQALVQEIEKDNFTDRKSTRLNSSHRCISYAVFCLKKKK